MKRLALIVAAPVLVAVVLALTSIYRPGSGTAGNEQAAPVATTLPDTAVAVPATPAGSLVLGGRAGDLAVGLAVQRAGTERLELAATVLGPEGRGVSDLDVSFAAAGAQAPAKPCGEARYCAGLDAALPAQVSVRIEGSPTSEAEFDVPGEWRPGRAVVAKATRVYRKLESVAYEERLSNGQGTTLVSSWRIAAPDQLAYEIEGGPSAVVIGKRRWDRKPRGTWIRSPQDPLELPEPPWTSAVRNASIIGSDSLRGHEVSVVSFLDQAALPTWFTLWVDTRTGRTLELSMTTSAHFMHRTYTAFDDVSPIVPPAGRGS